MPIVGVSHVPIESRLSSFVVHLEATCSRLSHWWCDITKKAEVCKPCPD